MRSLTISLQAVSIDSDEVDSDALVCNHPNQTQVKAALQILIRIARNRKRRLRIYQQGKRGGWKRATINPEEVTSEDMALVDPSGQMRFF